MCWQVYMCPPWCPRESSEAKKHNPVRLPPPSRGRPPPARGGGCLDRPRGRARARARGRLAQASAQRGAVACEPCVRACPVAVVEMAKRPTNPGIELYKSIGVNPVINGIGSVTFLVSQNGDCTCAVLANSSTSGGAELIVAAAFCFVAKFPCVVKMMLLLLLLLTNNAPPRAHWC